MLNYRRLSYQNLATEATKFLGSSNEKQRVPSDTLL